MVTVRRMLDTKRLEMVVMVTPEETVADAAALLAQHDIGAVIVSSDGRTAEGILSERDVIQGLAARGASLIEIPVSELMTRDVIACHPQDTALSVLERMTEGRFRHMPVVENGELVGMISIRDAVRVRMEEMEKENSSLVGMIANSW